MRKIAFVLVAAAAVGIPAYLYLDRATESESSPAAAPREAASARGESRPGPEAAAPATLGAGDAEERHLVGVVLREDPAQSQAHIMRRGATGVYQLEDEVPPDQAVLSSIQINQVVLRHGDGRETVLKLENLSAEERFLYSPEVNLDEVEDVVGDLSEAETPEGKALQEKYPDPYKPCATIADAGAQQDCEDRIDEEMEAAADACEKIEDADEYDRCLESAYRFTAEAAARAKAR